MTNKLLTALLAAAGTLTIATSLYAADAAPAPAPEPAPVPEMTARGPAPAPKLEAKVPMADAIAAAEKAYDARTLRSALRPDPFYGLVWDLRLEREDGTRVHALVSAEKGDVLAADVMGIRRAPREGRPGPGCNPHARGFHHGMPHPMIQGEGKGPRPECPYGAPQGRPDRGPQQGGPGRGGMQGVPPGAPCGCPPANEAPAPQR